MNPLLPLLVALPIAGTSPSAPLGDTQEVTPAPIQAAAWIGHYGQAPSNASLLGRTVLIEAWATW